MDRHKREDVVKYRNEVFLPLVAKYEARMNQYEGPKLQRVELNLAPGEKRIIAFFYDECYFHANDDAQNLW